MSDEQQGNLGRGRPSRSRPVYRYTEEEMQHIKKLIYARNPEWLTAVWDPVLQHTEGITMAEATEVGFEVDVTAYGIPWTQSQKVSGWLADIGVGLSMTWLSYGPSPVEEQSE